MLVAAVRVWTRRLSSVIHSHGHLGIHPRHSAIFAHLHRGGMTIASLAAAAGVGKAAMGALTDELTRLGYVQRQQGTHQQSPLIVLTAAGSEVSKLTRNFDRQFEGVLRSRLGVKMYNELRGSLTGLVSAGDELMQPAES